MDRLLAGRTVSSPLEQARAVADAVLYEGYVLYPYRASAPKNQVRWQWGVLMPHDVVERDESERTWCRTAVVVDGAATALRATVRFLQVQHRSVEDAGGTAWTGSTPVTPCTCRGTRRVEQEHLLDVPLDAGATFDLDRAGRQRGRGGPRRAAGAGARTARAARDDHGRRSRCRRTPSRWCRCASRTAPGRPRRRDEPARVAAPRPGGLPPAARGRRGVVRLPARPAGVGEGLRRGLRRTTASSRCWPARPTRRAWCSARRSSSTTTPSWLRRARRAFFDALEIDELLSLRTMTLSEEEKREVRGTDPRAAALLDEVDDMPAELWDRLHGTVRYLDAMTPARLPTARAGGPAGRALVGPGLGRVGRSGERLGPDRRRRRTPRHPRRAPPRRTTRPTPTTCSSPVTPPRWPPCCTTSTARSTWPSPSTRTPEPT